MPLVVPGLSSGASSSRVPPSTTLSSQDSERENSTLRPVRKKTKKTVPKYSRGDLEHSRFQKGVTTEHGETRCGTFQNERSSLKVWWTEELQRTTQAAGFLELSVPGTPQKSGIREAQCVHAPLERPKLQGMQKDKIARASCRERTNTHFLSGEKFGDSTTADHKVHNEDCESCNSHR